MAEKHRINVAKDDVKLIRIMGKDLPGNKTVLHGLTKVKGISFAFSNALCKILTIGKETKIQDLMPEQMTEIQEFVKKPTMPGFLLNRQKDFDSGDDKHVSGVDLDMRKEFDVKRLKKIKSYRGSRHQNNLPVRGQRTKSNFRKNRRKSGVTGIKKK